MLDLVIPDSGPLITFGLIGRLDLLDRFRCAIVVVDMVVAEVMRGPETAPDKPAFRQWFKARGNRIQTVETTYGAMWNEIPDEARRRIKRLHPSAGELAIREFTDRLAIALPAGDQALVLFEEDAVKTMHFGPQVHLLHTYAFLLSLEKLGVLDSADAMVETIRSRGRNLARDPFERRARLKDGAFADGRKIMTMV